MILKLNYIRRNPWVGWLIRLALAVFILILLFARIGLDSVLQTLGRVNTRLLVPALILFFAVRLIWAYLRSLCLRPLGLNFTVPQLFKIILISTFYNLIFPGGIVTGSAVAWYKLSRPERKGIEAGALLVFLRLTEMLTLLAIGLIGMWFDPRLTSILFSVVVAAMFLGVVFLFLPFVSPTASHAIERMLDPVLHRLPVPNWLWNAGQKSWTAVTALQLLGRRRIASMLLLYVLSHILGILVFYLLALAVEIHLSVFVIGWLHSVLSIIQMMPVSIAGLGVREVSLVVLLRSYGIPEAQALSFSLTVFSLTLVGGTVGGMLEAWDLFQSGRHSDRPVSKQKTEADTRIATQ